MELIHTKTQTLKQISVAEFSTAFPAPFSFALGQCSPFPGDLQKSKGSLWSQMSQGKPNSPSQQRQQWWSGHKDHSPGHHWSAASLFQVKNKKKKKENVSCMKTVHHNRRHHSLWFPSGLILPWLPWPNTELGKEENQHPFLSLFDAYSMTPWCEFSNTPEGGAETESTSQALYWGRSQKGQYLTKLTMLTRYTHKSLLSLRP